MNILLYDQAHRHKEFIYISQIEKIQHIKNILKLKVGDELRVGEINGLIGLAKIRSIDEALIILEPNLDVNLNLDLNLTAPAPLPCEIVLALPRPQQLKRILVHLSSLGIKRIHLIQTERVEKNYWQSPTLKKIESYLIEGLEQAQDTFMPEVSLHPSFIQFIENKLPIISKHKKLWFAHPGHYAYCQKQNSGEHVIFIGPEGGFIPKEVEQLISFGCDGISLGTRILKVETALPILLGAMFQLP